MTKKKKTKNEHFIVTVTKDLSFSSFKNLNMKTNYQKHKSSTVSGFPFYTSKTNQTMLDQTKKWDKSSELYYKWSEET